MLTPKYPFERGTVPSRIYEQYQDFLKELRKKEAPGSKVSKGATDFLGKRPDNKEALETSAKDQVIKKMKTLPVISIPQNFNLGDKAVRRKRSRSLSEFDPHHQLAGSLIPQVDYEQQMNIFRMSNVNPKSPPNELDQAVFEKNAQERPQIMPTAIKFDITDEMIAKYQKMDSILNFGIEKVNEKFTSYLLIKNLLEFFFTRYSALTSNLLHSISRENLEFILSSGDIFNEEDIATIYKVGTYDPFYSQNLKASKGYPSTHEDFTSRSVSGKSIQVSDPLM